MYLLCVREVLHCSNLLRCENSIMCNCMYIGDVYTSTVLVKIEAVSKINYIIVLCVITL